MHIMHMYTYIHRLCAQIAPALQTSRATPISNRLPWGMAQSSQLLQAKRPMLPYRYCRKKQRAAPCMPVASGLANSLTKDTMYEVFIVLACCTMGATLGSISTTCACRGMVLAALQLLDMTHLVCSLSTAVLGLALTQLETCSASCDFSNCLG